MTDFPCCDPADPVPLDRKVKTDEPLAADADAHPGSDVSVVGVGAGAFVAADSGAIAPPVPLDPRVDALARKLIYWDWDNLENSESSRIHPRGHARELLAVVDAVDPVRAELGAARAEIALLRQMLEFAQRDAGYADELRAALGAARDGVMAVSDSPADPVPLDPREPEIKFAHDGDAVRVIYHDVDGRQVVDLHPRELANRRPCESAHRFASWLGALVAELGAARARTDAALKLHKPYPMYDECEHDACDKVWEADSGVYVCGDVTRYVCETCRDEDSSMADHPCATAVVLGAAVLGGEPE